MKTQTNLTYNVVFNDDNNSNDKGFKESFEYNKSYIDAHNGSSESYFLDYKGGTVSIICNETGECVFTTKIKSNN